MKALEKQLEISKVRADPDPTPQIEEPPKSPQFGELESNVTSNEDLLKRIKLCEDRFSAMTQNVKSINEVLNVNRVILWKQKCADSDKSIANIKNETRVDNIYQEAL